MHDVVERLLSIKSEIKELLKENKTLKLEPNIIAVCKTFPMVNISPLIQAGHIHFGENRVQEAESKWQEIKKENSNIKLHMLGKLQTNKVKSALKIFDYIHSVDNYKLAEKIAHYEKELGKKIKAFVQVNITQETQKNGIDPKELNEFVDYCKNNLSLNIIGLMCLPPIGENPKKYFSNLNQFKEQTNLSHLSIGMTTDYLIAVKHGSSFLRIGTKIFGSREKN